MKLFETFELKYSAPAPAGNEAQVDLTAVFSCNGKDITVKGFYAGNETYIVRFLPKETGTYTYTVSGVVTDVGTAECTDGGAKGMVQAVGTHFEYQNGDLYVPFGTTIYVMTLQEEALIEQTVESLKNAPFNKVRHGIFPKHYDYNSNEPDHYPFFKDADGNWDPSHPDYEYWDHFEKYVHILGQEGIETDLILFHPYDRWNFSKMGLKNNLIYLDYALRRLSAIPYIWWSLANEYDLFFDWTMEDWYAVEEFVAANDPYGHLLSNHNCFGFYDFSRPNVTHCCVQTLAMHRGIEWMEKFGKPVVYDECCYEGNIQHEWGNISGWEMTNRFWKALSYGAGCTHGETFFSDDDILWWSKGGKLKGTSPKRIQFLKDVIYGIGKPLEPWADRLMPTCPDTKFAQVIDFRSFLEKMPPKDAEDMAIKSANFAGHHGEEVYLKYFGIQNIALTDLYLPAEHTYKVEVLNIWDMTRETLTENASGCTRLRLPGKEGTAVLATKIK